MVNKKSLNIIQKVIKFLYSGMSKNNVMYFAIIGGIVKNRKIDTTTPNI